VPDIKRHTGSSTDFPVYLTVIVEGILSDHLGGGWSAGILYVLTVFIPNAFLV
jgi:hypothetical protein